MPEVRIPTPLRRLTGGAVQVTVDGADLRTVVANLDAAHPGLAARLLDGTGDLHRFVHVFVGDEDVRGLGGLDTRVTDTDTVSIVPAVAGGAERSEHARRGDVAGGAERQPARSGIAAA